MSKVTLVVSLAAGLVLVAAGWWSAKIFSPPPTYSTEMIAYGVMRVPDIALRLGDGRHDSDLGQIKGPVPIAMPTALFASLAKREKVKGDIVALLDVDASGSVAGVREIIGHYSRNVSADLTNSVLDLARTWKFRPAMEKDQPVAAMVIVQVRF